MLLAWTLPLSARDTEALVSWSEQSEADMLAEFNPGGDVPVTATPTMRFEKGQLHLESASEGASMGYQINGGVWQVYSVPVKVTSGSEVLAKAVRYGWEESDTLMKSAP